MSRIDLVRLRKRAGMSQRELADRLQVRPSFLSAIENGRSRIPNEKLEKIKDIFELDSLDDYIIDAAEEHAVPPHTHATDQSEALAQLLNHFHDLAHQHARSNSGQDADTSERLDFLTRRNDRLSEKVDNLRDEIDRLREENLRLKDLLVKNGISY